MLAADWDTELANAFEILLRKPLSAFDPSATYELWHWDDVVSSDFFDEDLDLALLTRGETISAPFDGVPVLAGMMGDGELSFVDWTVDLGQSVFEFDGDIGKLNRPRPGTEVGRILAKAKLDAGDVAEEYVRVDALIHTDGSLFDAMLAATWTRRGPDGLVSFDPDGDGLTVKPKWERRLAAIDHSGLRDHLRMLCLDADSARSTGACYIGAKHPGFAWMAGRGYRVIAGWEFGEGQATSVVTQRAPRQA